MHIPMIGSECVGEYPFGVFALVFGGNPAQAVEKAASLFAAIGCNGERQVYVFDVSGGNVSLGCFYCLREAA